MNAARKSNPPGVFGPPVKAAGEAWVWLTSMGLAVGLIMIVFLLGLVVIKGVEAFWPRRVVQITVKDDSSFKLIDAVTYGGEVALRREKRSHDRTGQPAAERQLYVGNRDVYGLSFKFIDEADIVSEEQPAEIVKIERIDGGPAIGIPLRIESAAEGGKALSATDAGFAAEFERLVDEVNERREAIRHIEQKDIGHINAKLERLARRERTLEKKASGGVSADAKRTEIEAARADLQARYETLAAEARKLREAQEGQKLVYQLLSGQERAIAVGDIIHFHHPNRLSGMERLGLFLRNVWVFLSEEPRNANTEGGIFPAIFGTFAMTLLMSIAVMPIGVMAAIYLREYAVQGAVVRAVRIAVNNLAGVPSIVFGVFGLGFFVYFMGGSIDSLFFNDRLPTPTFGTGGIFWASLTLAVMTVPVVIVATEEALASVSRGVREGSLACGASKWQTIQRVVLPAAAPGILTGLILAMARGAGEVAPLMLVGVVKHVPDLPIDGTFPFVHLDQKFMHLGFHIYDLGFQSPDAEAAKPMVFATTLLLIGLVVALNLGAIIIRERLRRKYATGAF